MAAYLKRSRLGSASVAQADEVKPRPLGSEPAQSI